MEIVAKRLIIVLATCLAHVLPMSARAPVAIPHSPFAQPPDVQDIVLLTPNRPVFIRLHLTIDGKPYRNVWQSFISYLHNYFDANKDGLLDADEQKSLPPAHALFDFSVEGSTGAIRFFDAPSHIQPPKPIRVRELMAKYRSRGATAFQFDLSDRYDLDVTVWNFAPSASIDAAALNESLLAELDRNKNGRISRAELRVMEKRMLKRDFDDDEVLTPREAVGDSAPRSVANPFVPNLNYDFGRRIPPQLLEVTSPRPADAKRLALLLMETYRPRVINKPIFGLTRDQLGIAKEIFVQLDKNDDEMLAAAELMRFTLRKPDVEMSIKLTNETHPSVPRPTRAKVIHVGAIHLDFQTPPMSSASLPRSSTTVDAKAFADVDRDGNGYLDEREAWSTPYASTFALIDADKDGKVFLKEVKACISKYHSLLDRARRSYVSLNVADDDRGLFGLMDTDRDDRLSVREMRNAVPLLKELDRNGDGGLSLKEIPRRYRLTMSTGRSNGGIGSLTTGARSWVAGAGSPSRTFPKGTPLWYKKMDRNRDGDVSAREFLGSKKLFDKFDTDGDGLLSAEEAVLADQTFRNRG